MAYKTKTELEEGNYIVYADDPGVVYDDSGSGGGGGSADFGDPVSVHVSNGSDDVNFSVNNVSSGDTVIYSNEDAQSELYNKIVKIAANAKITLEYYVDSNYQLVGVFSGKYGEEDTSVEYVSDSPQNIMTFTVPQVEGEMPSVVVKFKYQE